MIGTDSNKQLGIVDEDIAMIRRTRDPNPLPMIIIGVITTVFAFLLGYRSDTGSSEYPYASVAALSLANVGKGRVPWVGVLVILLVTFLSFGLGAFVANPPNYGGEPYYGVYDSEN